MDLGAVLAGSMVFPDHYAYAPDDILHAQERAENVAAQLIVTTEKDAVRIPIVEPGDMLARRLLVLGVVLEITEGQDALEGLLRGCVGKACG